jgi:sugar lactone lactonase YvrE
VPRSLDDLLRLAAAAFLTVALAACGGEKTASTRGDVTPLRIAEPGALALDPSGGLLVADRGLHRVVRIDLASGSRRLAVTGIRDIVAVAFDDMGRLYMCAGERIYRVDGARKTVIAGTGERGHAGDLGPATEASLAGAGGFEVDHDGTIVIAEYDNTIRFIHPNGIIETLAGTGKEGYAGDGGPARQALVAHPHDISIRRHGVVVADSHNGVLRFIADSGSIKTLARGFVAPIAVEGGPGNVLYVADGREGTIFRLPPGGGERERVGSASAPIGLAVDGEGNVYVSELDGERRVLRISPGGQVRTLATP